MYTAILEEKLLDELKLADEVWMAAGLITYSGLDFFKDLKSTIHILVGIDLPTPPDVLRQLMSWNLEGKIKFKVFTISGEFFHPKVYTWRKGGLYKSYVGSGNLTKGGWRNNIELFWDVENIKECKKLVDWFNLHMDQAQVIDENFISAYETKVWLPRQFSDKDNRERVGTFKETHENDHEFYFRQEDFDTFIYERAINKNDTAKKAREIVNRKLLRLHDQIFPIIQKKEWDLHHHHKRGKIVSSYAHHARASRVLDGMWLYYGKSQTEAALLSSSIEEDRSMNNHVRIQLIIRESTVGIWCAIGKAGGSRADRISFHNRIQSTSSQNDFFELISKLSDEYFIRLANVKTPYLIREIGNPKQLYNIVNQDFMNLDQYFIIGMNILPNDSRLKNTQIIDFILEEFTRLYPIYLFFKATIN